MKLTAKLIGTGNVFDAVNFRKASASRFKKDLAERMAVRMKEQKLNLEQSTEKIDCDVTEVRDIRKADVSRFEISELIVMARKLGFGLKVDVTAPAPSKQKLH